MPTFRRCVLLCVILGAHLVVFQLMSVGDDLWGERRSEETFVTLVLVDTPVPEDRPPSTSASSRRQESIRAPSVERSVAPGGAISLSSRRDETDARIDWDSEARRAAAAALARKAEEEKQHSFDHHPAGLGALPPKAARHNVGDSQHFEGGVIIDWISPRCYYSNENPHIDAFGPALRLQIPTCTGAGGGDGNSLQSFEEWKKGQANR